MAETAGVAIIELGHTQAGKTTLMNSVLEPGQQTEATGDGSGESVTQKACLRQTKLGPLLDGPGFDDSKLRFTNEDVGMRYAVTLAEAEVQNVKVLLFEVLASAGRQLRRSLASLVTAFGANALPGVVVVVTHWQTLPEQAKTARINALRAIMDENNLMELVMWDLPESLQEDQRQQQLEQLQQALSRTPAVRTAALEDLWKRQARRAQELCDAHPTQTKQVQVEETYVEPYEEEEEYEEQEAYEDQESYEKQVSYTYEDQYEAVEEYTDIEKQTKFKVEQREGERRYGFAGPREKYDEVITWVEDVPVTRYRTVSRTRPATGWRTETATRPVTKYRSVTRTRMVTRQRTATRMVTKTVEYRKPVEDFYQLALTEVLTEVRRSFGTHQEGEHDE